jgi:alpha-glucuronidase
MMWERKLVNRLAACFVAALAALLSPCPAWAEDGYDLWLRYAPLEGEALARLERLDLVPIADDGATTNPTVSLALAELERGISSLQGRTSARGGWPVALNCEDGSSGVGGHYVVQPYLRDGAQGIGIWAAEPIGCLYGAFALLRALSTGTDPRVIDIASTPAMPLRMLNHWDNPDDYVERGYAGRSIFDWWHLPERLDPRMIDYARANASLGPMWQEVIGADTGCGGKVAQGIATAGMAGVANTGSDRNWTGSDFEQANWYAFGRLVWDPSHESEAIAREWAAQTFARLARTWADLAPYINQERHRAVAERLEIQQREARWWRDASLAYWQSLNGAPLPAGTEPQLYALDHYKLLTFPGAPGQ